MLPRKVTFVVRQRGRHPRPLDRIQRKKLGRTWCLIDIIGRGAVRQARVSTCSEAHWPIEKGTLPSGGTKRYKDTAQLRHRGNHRRHPRGKPGYEAATNFLLNTKLRASLKRGPSAEKVCEEFPTGSSSSFSNPLRRHAQGLTSWSGFLPAAWIF